MGAERITRRGFIGRVPILAAAAAGILAPRSAQAVESSAGAPAARNGAEATLTCPARVERVERFDHTAYIDGKPIASWEVQATCTAYDDFGEEFPLHLYYCFMSQEGADAATARLLATLRPGALLLVSGCVAFSRDGNPPTVYDARLLERTG